MIPMMERRVGEWREDSSNRTTVPTVAPTERGRVLVRATSLERRRQKEKRDKSKEDGKQSVLSDLLISLSFELKSSLLDIGSLTTAHDMF